MKEGFSEYRFSRELHKYGIDCFAIGIPRELDSPYGANRIYCDFDDWRFQVADMIRRSAAVFIVMDAKDSCIWEVEVCIREPIEEKTVFYFKDWERFNLVSKKTSLPEISDTQSFPYCLFHGCYRSIASSNKSMMYSTIIEEMIIPNLQQR